MSRYIIHASPKRMWYVEKYLFPSMIAQGINNIEIRCDYDRIGCLESCMRIFNSIKDDGGSWHIQDDVIICRDFKKLTEEFDHGVVCGFTAKPGKLGSVRPDEMWWSFPCIRIPDKLANECAEWYYTFAKKYAKYYEWVQMNKCDDNFFWEFMKLKHPNYDVTNLCPNLVDHVDFLLGGSLVNQYRRGNQVRAQYFEDKDLVEELAERLKE